MSVTSAILGIFSPESHIRHSWTACDARFRPCYAILKLKLGLLTKTVKRNARRFPDDFMFQLTEHEWNLISSQFVMTSRMKRPKKSLPYAFTELGALMLSSVLRSPVADETSIKITRAFVAMRQMLTFSTLPEKVVTLAQELYKLILLSAKHESHSELAL